MTDPGSNADLLERLSAYRSTLENAITLDLEERSATKVETEPNDQRRWLLLTAATLLVIAGVGALGRITLGPDSGGPVNSDSSSESPATASTTPTTIVETTIDDPTTNLVPPSTGPEPSVGPGDAGDHVRRVQQRLLDLGYVLQNNGQFDDATRSAVWAFQKLQGDTAPSEVSDLVTPELWQEMADATVIAPRRDDPSGAHVEVYLPEQVVAAFDQDGTPVISHMSSGDGASWCDTVTISPGELGNDSGTAPVADHQCGIGATPGGIFDITRIVADTVETGRGQMHEPVYFNYDVALYGADDVPAWPSTRGGVSVSMSAIESLREHLGVGDPVIVWDGDTEPEVHGAPPPVFNWPSPTGAADVPNEPTARFAIGDQVMLSAASELADAGFIVDAAVSRPPSKGFETIDRLQDAPYEQEAVVIHLGTNSPIDSDELDATMRSLTEVPEVRVLTVALDPDSYEYVDDNNELIRSLPDRFANVEVIDWAALVSTCPGDCLYDDGIHMRPDGQRFYAQLITEAVGGS